MARTPRVKATRPQWRYALRNGIAMCLALSIAYALDLDEPYWAMTSAAVVSFPTVGGVISKSFGRIAGSLLGACAALLLAGHTLNDPRLFLFSISGWLALCTWACALFTNNVAYAFQLAGYTCAIIAFPVINISDSYELWVIAQSRVCEVIVGILCGGLMMMILPSTSDGSNLLTALKTMHARLLEHASLLWVPETTDAIRTAHESVIGQILTMNLLRIRAFWSHYRFRRQNPLLNYLLHQQLRMTSVISSLRRMLLNWPDAPANTRRYWSRCSPSSPPLMPTAITLRGSWRRWRRGRMPITGTSLSGRDCAISVAFIRRAAAGSAALKMPRRSPSSMFPPPAVSPPYRSGGGVAQRCPYLLRAGGDWRMGISTQWTSCAAALTLASICCVLYSVSASPFRSLTLLMQTLVLLSLFSFVVKFGLMVQVTDLWQFLLFLFPLLTTMQLLKLQWPKYAGLWGQLIVFMGSFIAVTNPPVYDYAAFSMII